VIEAAGFPSAHVFGISMGGMIAQEPPSGIPNASVRSPSAARWRAGRQSRAPAFRTKLDLLLLNLGRVTADRIGRILVSREWHEKNPGAALQWIRRAERTALRYAVAQLLAIARHHALPRLARIARRPW